MKITKKVIAAVFIFGIGISATNAQRFEGQRLDPEKMAEKQTQVMTEKLGLDEKQSQAVSEINLKYAKQQNAEHEKRKAERDALRAERQQVQEAKKAELKNVLTPEQFEQMEKLQADREQRMKERKGGRKGGRDAFKDKSPEERAAMKTERMSKSLGLNDKQTKELAQLNLDFSKKMEQQKEGLKAEKEAMKQLHEEHKANIEKILTPEQLEKFKASEERMKHHHKGRGGQNDSRM